jgi:hypothetical protein
VREHPLWKQIKRAYSEDLMICVRTEGNYFANARIQRLSKKSIDFSYSYNNENIYTTRLVSIRLDAITLIESDVGIFDKSLEPLVVIPQERDRPLF